MRTVYLDHAATTPARPEVLDAMWPFFAEVFGNPSSVHEAGLQAKEALARAREAVAAVLGCRPAEIVFTSGGTEGDNLALLGAARASRSRGRHIITSRIEHDAVLEACRALEREGFRVTYLPVDCEGRVDIAELERQLDSDTVLVSIMTANNEVGTVQPIAEIGKLAHAAGALFHTDAVQAAGALSLNVESLGVDLLTISAHKIYGPKGVGALYAQRGTPLAPLIHGGEQERGRRAGTENVAGVVGLAVALSLAERERETEAGRLAQLRDRLIDGVLERTPGAHLTGPRGDRLPGHASFYLDGVSGESVLVDLDLAGIQCSSGSACKAGSTDPSHVLTALGLAPGLARNGLRMTLGRGTSAGDVDYVLETLPRVVAEACSGALVT
ncbi:MAG TPA: cysteine desulfurase family protein [Chloroflexota bacterium]|nr:cysteine desulfurase family protein [Chloroflexota bacterium]